MQRVSLSAIDTWLFAAWVIAIGWLISDAKNGIVDAIDRNTAACRVEK